MSLYHVTIPTFTKMLTNLDHWLEAAVASADQRKFDPEVLLGMRLAPDMFPLVKQVQGACDAAKFAAAYLAGQTAPSHPDTEQTLPEIRARIQTCLAYLGTFSEDQFAGAEERRVAPAWLKGRWVLGQDYVGEVALPNFMFHLTIAYAILRHAGVPLGKSDFIGSMSVKDSV